MPESVQPNTLRGNVEALPHVLKFLFDSDIGGSYGVGFWRKVRLVWLFNRNARNIETLSSVPEHLELAAEILRLPPSLPGDIVECGCYLGGSSVDLSLVCALVGRRLVVCDSFVGLPAPALQDQAHEAPHIEHVDLYYEGRFAASRQKVEAHLARFGRPDVCEFVAGFFAESLQDFDRDIVMGFLDVDLSESLMDCLRALWPRLPRGCRIYVHEARNLTVAAVCFNAQWWKDALGCAAPGLVGAGSGLPLTALRGSALGYCQKGTVATTLDRDEWPIWRIRRRTLSQIQRPNE